MITKKSNFLFLICSLLLPITAAADISRIAAKNEPAVGFPSDVTYELVSAPSIGKNSHIAFRGLVDTPISSSDPFTNAIWGGKADNLKLLIKEGESPIGLPSNAVFMETLLNTPIIVTDSGSIGFRARMSLPTSNAFLASIDNQTYAVTYNGAVAEGFPAGTTVNSLDSSYFFADAGFAYSAKISDGRSAVWLWNNFQHNLILTSGDELVTILPGCAAFQITPIDMNRSGEILFYISYRTTGDAECPSQGYISWKNNKFRKIISTGDSVPDMPANIIFKGDRAGGLTASINDNSDVIFRMSIGDNSFASGDNEGIWMVNSTGEIFNVGVNNQVAPDLQNRLFFNSAVSNANQNLISEVSIKQSSGATVGSGLFTGQAKTIQFDSTTEPGSTQLNALVDRNQVPPGFPNTWFFDSIVSPTLNDQDIVAFYGIIKDAISAFNNSFGIWFGDQNENLYSIVQSSDPAIIDGKKHDSLTFNLFSNVVGGSTNSANGSWINDNNEFVFTGSVNNLNRDDAIYHYKPSDCIWRFHANGSISAPCVRVSDDQGGSTVYEALLTQVSGEGIVFQLTSALVKNGLPIENECVATVNSDATVTVPCVNVPNVGDGVTLFEGQLKLIGSSPFKYQVTQAQPKS